MDLWIANSLKKIPSKVIKWAKKCLQIQQCGICKTKDNILQNGLCFKCGKQQAYKACSGELQYLREKNGLNMKEAWRKSDLEREFKSLEGELKNL